MTEPSNVLRFDRAEFADRATGGTPCASCKGPLGTEYWRWQRLVFCAKCRPKIGAQLASSQSNKALAKAALHGGGVALACGIGYAVFVGVTKFQLALLTIGIAYVVARVVRNASGGIGGTKFQVLAVALTYVASTMGYAPGIVEAVKHSAEVHAKATKDSSAGRAPTASPEHIGGAAAETANEPRDPAASNPTSTPSPQASSKGGLFALAYAVLFLLGVMLAMPFLEITSAPIGVLIVLIGLWQAWKLTRGVPVTLEGPFRVAAAQGGASDDGTAAIEGTSAS